MRRIFVINAANEKVAKELTDYVLLNKQDDILVPNVVFMSIYYDMHSYLTNLLITKFEDQVPITQSLLKILFKNYKQNFIDYVLEKIDSRDTPRTTLFIFCQNRILFHYIRKVYGYKIVKSVEIVTDVKKIEYELPANRFSKHDIKLSFPEWNNKTFRRRIISQFVNNHIPVKILKLESHE